MFAPLRFFTFASRDTVIHPRNFDLTTTTTTFYTHTQNIPINDDNLTMYLNKRNKTYTIVKLIF